jgi:hypothetical protein
MTTPSGQNHDQYAPSPLNLIGRQWSGAQAQTGWRRACAVAGIGAEAIVVVLVVLLLIL